MYNHDHIDKYHQKLRELPDEHKEIYAVKEKESCWTFFYMNDFSNWNSQEHKLLRLKFLKERIPDFNMCSDSETLHHVLEENRNSILFKLELSNLSFREYSQVLDILFYENNMRNISGKKITFSNCTFRKCDFLQAKFDLCEFKNITFEDCSMTSLSVDGCIFVNCKWENCNLDISGIIYSSFSENIFQDTSFYDVNFSCSKFFSSKTIGCTGTNAFDRNDIIEKGITIQGKIDV